MYPDKGLGKIYMDPLYSDPLPGWVNSQLHMETYSADSRIRQPWQLAKQMWRDLLTSRSLAWRLLVRDISAQYRQSILGIFWAFLPPLVTALGLTLASNAKILNLGTTDLPYPAYVMFSMTLWQTFTEAVTGQTQALVQAKPMLAKINFPREALVLAKLGEVLFHFGIKLIFIVLLFIWFRIAIEWTVILAFVSLLHLILLGTALGMLLAPLGTLFQDFPRGLTMLLGFWLFITPVLYPLPQGEGLFSQFVRFNPVTPLLVTTRELSTVGVVSQPTAFWIASGIAVVGLFVAWLFQRLSIPFVVERLSA